MIFLLINQLFNLFKIMIFVRIIGSWVPELQQYRFMHFVAFYVDPYLNAFRRIIPPLGMIDLSPIIAIIALSFIQNMVLRLFLI